MQLTTRRITDLWVVGRELVLDDNDGPPITVWIQKLNATESADVNRRCDAQRARVLATRNDPDSDQWQVIESSVAEFAGPDRFKIVEFLLTEERAKSIQTHEARLSNEEEWSKDSYIQGLRDAWETTLERRWLEDHDDVEASRCKEELDRFIAIVSENVDSEIDAIREAWSEQSLDELQTRMGLKLLDMEGNQAWMLELWACQIYFGTRDPENRRVRYFGSRDEVDELSSAAFEYMHDAYSNLEVDAAEGKESRVPTDSSPSSVGPREEETAPLSGPVGASL